MVPFTMLMILAGLQVLPEEQVDAARMTEPPLAAHRHVVLPFLRGPPRGRPLPFDRQIKAFPLICILTDGGPGTSPRDQLLLLHQAFNFSQLGYSSAITVILVP